MSARETFADQLPESLLARWQDGINLLAQTGGVPVVAIAHALGNELEILRVSDGADARLYRGARKPLGTGCYCDLPVRSARPLHVRDARDDSRYNAGMQISGGFPAYFGFPLRWPDGSVFGTVFALDTQANEFNGLFRRLFDQVVRAMEAELAILDDNLRLREEIIQRELAETLLRERKRQLEEAHRLAQLGHWHLDLTRNHLEWSAEIFRIFEIDERRFGADYEAFLATVHPDDRDALDRVWKESVEKRMPYEFEHRLQMADGRIKWVIERGHTQYDDGTPLVSTGTVQDITARREAERERELLERQLQHAQRLESLGMLAGGLAHDFNNILQVILGNLELARSDDDDAARDALERARQGTLRAADITRQLLAFSGRDVQPRQRVDLGQIVEESAGLMRAVVNRRIDLDIVPAGEPLPVDAAAGQLQQVLINLVTNAADAIGDAPGRIVIRCGPSRRDPPAQANILRVGQAPVGEHFFLEVSDSGCGMDDATRARVFDPFFTSKPHGHGLGMPTVLGIVRGHGGAIDIDSAPGQGSRLRVLLPATSAPPETTAPRVEIPLPAQANHHLLLIDDDESVLLVGRELLRRRGFTVTTCSSGDEAMQMLAKTPTPFAGVVLDLTMPNADGATVYHFLRERHPELPVLLASGYDHSEAMRRIRAGARTGFLQKPWRGAELFDALSRLLERAV